MFELITSIVGTVIGCRIYVYALKKYRYRSSVVLMSLFLFFSNLTFACLGISGDMHYGLYLLFCILISIFVPYMAVRKAASAQP